MIRVTHLRFIGPLSAALVDHPEAELFESQGSTYPLTMGEHRGGLCADIKKALAGRPSGNGRPGLVTSAEGNGPMSGRPHPSLDRWRRYTTAHTPGLSE